MEYRPKSWVYKLILTVILSLLAAGLLWAGMCGPVARLSRAYFVPVGIVRYLSLLSFAVLFSAPAIFLLASYCAIRTRGRNARVNWLMIALGMAIAWPSTYYAYRSGLESRRVRLEQAADRGRAVIDALHDFKADRGEYPDTLGALVPDYLPSAPETGMLLFRRFEYLRQPDRGLHRGCKGYQLGIVCPMTVFSWDFLFYWPNDDYPFELHASEVKTIGDWGYVQR
jgi:hypothetical protein